MSQKQVRKRGANYTQEEKSMLLDLIRQFKHIVENKGIGGMIMQKKKEAWHAITIKYNSNCSSGPRDTEQLKVLYDNMKQKSRKGVGEINRQIHKTGGGFWKPKITDNEAKVLSIIQEEIEPLSKPNDSASGFFKEAVANNEKVLSIIQEQAEPLSKHYDSASGFFKEAVANNESQINISPSLFTPTQDIPENVLSLESQMCNIDSPKTIPNTARRKVLVKKIGYKQKKVKKCMSADAYKTLYFKKKCQNADWERKKIIMEIVNQRKEHNLKMELLRSQLTNIPKNNFK